MTTPYPGDTNWPSDFQGCVLTGSYVALDGTPISGSITLSASPEAVLSAAMKKIVIPTNLVIPLDATGSFSVTVPATDDPDINPTRWTYHVKENFTGGRQYDIQAPQNTTVDLTAAAPVASANGIAITRGVSVTSASVDGNDHLQIGLSDGTTIDAGLLPSGSGGGASINDTTTGTATVWSSSKTSTSISAAQSAATSAATSAAESNAAASYVPLTRKVNNKPLSGDVTITATDVNAVAMPGGATPGSVPTVQADGSIAYVVPSSGGASEIDDTTTSTSTAWSSQKTSDTVTAAQAQATSDAEANAAGLYVPLPGSAASTGSVPTKQSDGSIVYQLPASGGGSTNDELARVAFFPAAAQTDATTSSTTATTPVDIAASGITAAWTGMTATGLDAVFTAPASGSVVVEVSLYLKAGTNANLQVGLYDVTGNLPASAGGSGTGTPQKLTNSLQALVSGATGQARATYRQVLSGLSAGTVYTVRPQWASSVDTIAGTISVGGTNGNIMVRVLGAAGAISNTPNNTTLKGAVPQVSSTTNSSFGVDSTVNNLNRTLLDASITSGSTVLSSPSGAWSLKDIGADLAPASGYTGIPAGTKVKDIISTTQVHMTNAATATLTGDGTTNNTNPLKVAESSTLQERINLIRAGYGGTCGPHMKFFDSSSGWTTAYNSLVATDYGSQAGETWPVICGKVDSTTDFNTLMTNMAVKFPGGWYACFYQEVNDEIVKGTYTASAYRTAWANMKTARAAHPHGSLCKFVPIMNAYTVEDQASQAQAAGADTQTLLQGVTFDVLGYDIYDDSWRNANWSASTYVGPLATAAASFGVPWAICEFGAEVSTKLINGVADTEAGRDSRIQSVINYCLADKNFAWANYWEGGGNNGDWTSIGTGAQTVWASAMGSTETIAQAVARIQTSMGNLDVVRLYDGGAGPASVLSTAKSSGLWGGGTDFLLSFRKWTPTQIISGTGDSELTTFFTNLPASVYWSYYYEFDNHIYGGTTPTFAASDYVSAVQHIVNLAKSCSGYKGQHVLIYSGTDMGNRFAGPYPGDAYVDVIGVDRYSSTVGQTADQLLTASDVFGALQAANCTKPLAVCETGATFSQNPDDADTAAYINSWQALFGDGISGNPLKMFIWYEGTTTNYDYRIESLSQSSAAFRALTSVGSGGSGGGSGGGGVITDNGDGTASFG